MAKNYSRYVIRSLDQDASGGRPYWCGGKVKDWVPGQAFATLYTQKQRDQIERDKLMPARGVWEAVGVSADDFLSRYKLALIKAIKADPYGFNYGLDEVDMRARRIVGDLKTGDAEIRDIAKEVAASFGIPATKHSLQTFLNSQPSS
jgi:hypothetical protein